MTISKDDTRDALAKAIVETFDVVTIPRPRLEALERVAEAAKRFFQVGCITQIDLEVLGRALDVLDRLDAAQDEDI